MKTNSLRAMALACALAVSMTVPADVFAEPQTAGQRAGEVSRVIPAVNIARGSKTLSAAAKTVVDWQDVVNTQASARARLSLDDGSVLNVGSGSSVRVAKHDAAAQQTDLEISLGKMRTQAQKITQPNGKFEVHTPAGVAGVVGTDFYTAYENNVMNVIVFDGVVKVCNLAGVCVMVKAGQMSTVRSGDNSAPTVAQAALSTLTDAIAATNLEGPSGLQQVHHISKGTAIALGVIAAVPIVVIPIVATRGTSNPPAQPVKGQCPPNQPACAP
ncbi:MAG TPA: FecR family protein [Dongiaceae bacterium]|nr:FecR family protein [Dongiaceae bacterium]